MHEFLPVYVERSELDRIVDIINANIRVVNEYIVDATWINSDFAEFAKFAVAQTALTRHLLYRLGHVCVPCRVFSDLYRAWEDSDINITFNYAYDIAYSVDNLGIYNSCRSFLFAIPINAQTDKILEWSDFYDNQDDIDKHIANELEHMGKLCNLVWQSVSQQTDSER